MNYLRAVSVFADLKQQYGAGNCHLLQINSKRAGQISSDLNDGTNMPDPWRIYVKQSTSSQRQTPLVSKKDSVISDSISNLTELIDQELNFNSMYFSLLKIPYRISYFLASVSHPLGLSDTSSNDLSLTSATDEGYDVASITSTSTVIHGACLTLSDHDRIHVFM